MAQQKTYRLMALIVLAVLLVGLLVSGCDVSTIFESGVSGGPPESAIYTPADRTKVIAGSPVQIQSGHVGKGMARVELYVNNQLQRADIPQNGRVTQEWIPAAPGDYIINVKAFDINNAELTNLVTSVQVRDDAVIAPAVAAMATPVPSQAAAPASARFADEIAPPQQDACEFNAANAPLLNRFEVGGVGDISAAEASSAIILPASADTNLVVNWDAANAANFYLNVTNIATGQSQTVSSQNGTDSKAFENLEPGLYNITFNARNGACSSSTSKTIQVGDVPMVMAVTATPTFLPPTPTPIPSATPTAYYPPPPPAPGVPLGPVQAQLPALRPPVCDAADFVGIYLPASSDRVFIAEDDMVPAKTVGGTLVHRAWRIQNTGTCTWGPGYELAFYGGRAMGSGGVAFESFFPNEPARRNIVDNPNRLVAAEGKPNQVAVVEVALTAPVTPGIHQTYWRMRNPQGVYFGPIVGVTLEIVRDCKPGYYGAPVINLFQIGRVGNVFDPINPVNVVVEQDAPVTLEWNISNAQNYDIIIRGPVAGTKNVATDSLQDRTTITFDQVGTYIVTLYVDNGPCTYTADVKVKVVPKLDDATAYTLQVSNSGTIAGSVDINWRHWDDSVTEFYLTAERYVRSKDSESCGIVLPANSYIPSYQCEPTWGEWKPDTSKTLPDNLMGVTGDGLPPGVTSGFVGEISAPVAYVQYNGASFPVYQGEQGYAQRKVGEAGNEQGAATVTNTKWGLCPVSFNSDQQEYKIRYQMWARKGSDFATPKSSNIVDKACLPQELSTARSATTANPTMPPAPRIIDEAANEN